MSLRMSCAALLWLFAEAAWAQVEIWGAWARPAVAGQSGTGAFMQLRSAEGARVVGAASAVAGVVEIHEMKMDGTVMRMRALPELDLPAGKPVELKPGGYHVMLMDLRRVLKPGDRFTVELRVERKDKSLVTQPVEIEVRTTPPAGVPNHFNVKQ
jgi:periplasmic copper chaperone A